ncbi:hypothetical protein [Serratia marcescens]|uniref:hypothetical protein n=1 Tax=Serratia marcescens TaxID=615 RepID=UPI0012B89E1E|nr:hypothetical protein [Serratia marcescens]
MLSREMISLSSGIVIIPTLRRHCWRLRGGEKFGAMRQVFAAVLPTDASACCWATVNQRYRLRLTVSQEFGSKRQNRFRSRIFRFVYAAPACDILGIATPLLDRLSP